MIRKKMLAAIAVLLLCGGLCGCSVYQPDVESLLSAPMLSDLQDQVDAALRDVVGQDISLKYPAGGDYRSPYIFYDLDGDDAEEAIALYTLENSDVPYVQVLNNKDNTWYAGNALPASGNTVDFVAFPHLLSGDQKTFVIGWKDSESAANHLAVYHCEQNEVSKLYEADYTRSAILDYNNDGADEMVLVQSFGNGTDILLIGDIGNGTVGMLDSTHSFTSFQLVYEPVSGRITPTLSGIIMDGMVSSRGMISMMIGVRDGKLVLPQDGETSDLYSRTLRYTGVHSGDINNDGILEIPTGTLAAGYNEFNGLDASSQYFSDYHQFDGNDFQPICTTYENATDGYCFVLPTEWQRYYADGQLSIFRQAETQEVTFFLYQDSLNNRSQELLRLRVVSTTDQLDPFDSKTYTLLAKRGQFEYYAYIPAGTLSNEAVSALFQLNH